jgi:hypothetical protein
MLYLHHAYKYLTLGQLANNKIQNAVVAIITIILALIGMWTIAMKL